MPRLTPYKLFTSILWLAEQNLQSRDFYALGIAVHVLAEMAMEHYVAQKLAQDKALERRWDLIWHAHLAQTQTRVKPPVSLAESLIQEAEIHLEAGDWAAARATIPKLALLESIHGVSAIFPNDLADRVDVVRLAVKDHSG